MHINDIAAEESSPRGLDGAFDSQLVDAATVDMVIDIALQQFAKEGFQETKLDSIAKKSGMSKRMIHYHFGDKKGLYRRCIVEAFDRIHPTAQDVDIDSSVPVEGVTKLVNAVYSKMSTNPESVRVLSLECLHDVLNVTELSTMAKHSEVLLLLDKLLMIGQDSGAFRPGISADDLFYLLWSLTFFRVSHRDFMVSIFDVDTTSEDNTAGIRRLTVDSILAFLTSNLSNNGHDSYLVSDRVSDEEQSSGLGVYDTE
ncbi:HTH-type transcriptional repressor NicS [Corynebacterium atrinae]|uniref:TetR/AcrR family transcriptional regulator n=1 Tax=Corynebacterium atrinae TaxID=1336740 RepID=UPI0025B5331D|nr:TetR/AcrR family transcriptional regulator [Corynebacterium atrinae]WJY64015.1 HTH-type transcriptional repressor NicS [Corynebacterium atrinae]